MTLINETWRALPPSTAPADSQLASGDGLLAGLNPDTVWPALVRPALHWYTITPPALILGVGQRLSAFDRAACQAAGLTLHRRASGGTAVAVEPSMLMLDIALPRTHRLYYADVTASYRWLGALWAHALEALGVQAHVLSVAEARADTKQLDALTRHACFGGQSPYEVLVAGRKLIGLAQVRRKHGALLQAGVYTHWQPERLARALALADEERAALVARLRTRVVGLAEVIESCNESSTLFARLQAAFAAALAAQQGAALVPTAWSAAERAAREVATARYAALALEETTP